MNQRDNARAAAGRARRPWPAIVLAGGLVWYGGAIVCSALVVPSDAAGGYYLINHGRIEHYDTRLGAVASFVVIGAVLGAVAGAAGGVYALLTRNGPGSAGPTTVPAVVALAIGYSLLPAGLIPLSVTAMAVHPNSVWTASLVLAPAALVVTVIFSVVARVLWRAYRAARDGQAES